MSAVHFEDVGGAVAERRRRSALHLASTVAAPVVARFLQWRRRTKERAELAALDDRMLADIGISRAEAEFLSNKPFWRE